MSVGSNLKYLRRVNGFTQKEIANYLGVDQSLVSKIEHDTRKINMTWLNQLCNLYCIEDYKLLNDDLTDYTPLNIQGETSDLQVIAKMNQVTGYLKLLRRLEN